MAQGDVESAWKQNEAGRVQAYSIGRHHWLATFAFVLEHCLLQEKILRRGFFSSFDLQTFC